MNGIGEALRDVADRIDDALHSFVEWILSPFERVRRMRYLRRVTGGPAPVVRVHPGSGRLLGVPRPAADPLIPAHVDESS